MQDFNIDKWKSKYLIAEEAKKEPSNPRDSKEARAGAQQVRRRMITKVVPDKKKNYKTREKIEEDLDLGHIDDEPHMVKGDLYKIAKYAMELYKMVDQFEGQGEVDFPAWWQSKITQACSMISSAKHYLEFELTEPEIDNMVRNTDHDSSYED
jgi:hypothetical protein